MSDDSAPRFQLQPTLRGPGLTLRPLAADDFEALHAVASDPLIWAQHPSRDRHLRPVFERWFAAALESGGALVAVANDSGQLIGSSRYYDWDAARREVAIGFSFLARSHWGGAANAEMKRLMLDHAFQAAERVWFHVAPANLRSQKALQKIGARFSHRAPKQLSGTTSEYFFYEVTRAGAPGLRIAYLADCEEHLPTVAGWQHTEFGDLNPAITLEQRCERLRACLQTQALPLARVALDANGAALGAASLLPATITHAHLTPWLSTVVVPPEARGRGIASALSLCIAEDAARLGFETVYLFTPRNESLYERLGWKTFERSTHAGRAIALMARPTRA